MERTYLPVLLLVGFVVMNAALILLISHLTLRPRPTAVKQTPYESGMPVLGDARERFSVKFYMVAVLFIIFDIETVFMIPWGAHFRRLSCDVDLVAGKRTDVLRREAGSWKIAQRRILLDQSTLTAGNLTTFF